MSDLFVPICFCGSGLPGITFGFASVALALHKVGLQCTRCSVRLDAVKARVLSFGKRMSQKSRMLMSVCQLYRLKVSLSVD